jgi:hypothetical protein
MNRIEAIERQVAQRELRAAEKEKENNKRAAQLDSYEINNKAVTKELQKQAEDNTKMANFLANEKRDIEKERKALEERWLELKDLEIELNKLQQELPQRESAVALREKNAADKEKNLENFQRELEFELVKHKQEIERFNREQKKA